MGVLRSLAMSRIVRPALYASVMSALWVLSAAAIAAPGEDPILLTKSVAPMQLPMGSGGGSSSTPSAAQLPSSVKAKIARLEAKVFSDLTDGVYTDADVKTTVTAGNQRKSCIQDVGSNTATSGPQRFGPGQSQQIVVLRGDLVNICN